MMRKLSPMPLLRHRIIHNGEFSEGFDSLSLRDAREMLEVMGAGAYHSG